jgi:hypothetical protein
MVQGDDRVEVKAEHEVSTDADGGERASGGGSPELAPPAAAEPPVMSMSRESGSDLTIPLLVVVALLAIALAVRSTLAGQRD